MTNVSDGRRVSREARLEWVPIALMRVNPLAQRDLNQARVNRLAANFDPEQVGTPTVSERDGCYYIVDGQHRIAAMRQMGWGDQQVQCWVYSGLSEREEAERFLTLNDYLAVNAFGKFAAAVTAGREEETDIDRIVRDLGLTITKKKETGSIACVSTLAKVYRRGGPEVLSRTLTIARDAYGDSGLEAAVIGGLGLLCQRYNGDLNADVAVDRLNHAHGGVAGLMGKARVAHRQRLGPLSHCVAAAAVEIINQGRGGKKLPNWWTSS